MSIRTRNSALQLVAAVAVAASVAACDNQNGLTGPGVDGEPATVEGRVDDGGQAGSTSSSPQSPSSTAPYAFAGADAATAAVAHVRGDGSLDVLAEADVEADGSFTIDDVPPGRSDLVVVARASDGAEVGRVLLHGETRSGAVVTTAPIDAETTVEGRVFAHLKEEGVAEETRSTARLALLIHMSEATAAQVAASAQAIQEVSMGVRAGVEAMSRTFAEVSADVDAEARADAMLEAAIQHAESRHAGADVEAATEAFLAAGVDALVQTGADAEVVALATAAAVTGVERALVEADEDTRLALIRNGVRLNLEARERLAASLSSSPSSSLAAGALADLRAAVEASASLGTLVQSILDVEAAFEEELTAVILSDLSALSESQRAEVEARLETAFGTADLSARVAGEATVAEIVQAVAEYRQELRAAVQAYAGTLPDDVTVGAQVSAQLLMAVCASPGVDE